MSQRIHNWGWEPAGCSQNRIGCIQKQYMPHISSCQNKFRLSILRNLYKYTKHIGIFPIGNYGSYSLWYIEHPTCNRGHVMTHITRSDGYFESAHLEFSIYTIVIISTLDIPTICVSVANTIVARIAHDVSPKQISDWETYHQKLT